MIPKDKLMNDPGSVFNKPSDVIDNMELSRQQKVTILQQWKQEVLLRLVAAEEDMTGDPEDANRLKEISNALIALEEG
jgi:hypothetical protein